MNNYIEATCIGRPLDLPDYNEQLEQWSLWFEESKTSYHPYDEAFRENINFPDLISYSCDSAEEACELYNYYNQNPVTEETKNEETISENLPLV
jgi:hypothetical protein